MSGGRLSECAGEENPCRQAYIDYLGYGLARYIFQLMIFKNDDDDDGDDGHCKGGGGGDDGDDGGGGPFLLSFILH